MQRMPAGTAGEPGADHRERERPAAPHARVDPTITPASAASAARRRNGAAPSASTAAHAPNKGTTTFQMSLSLPMLRPRNSGLVPTTTAAVRPARRTARRYAIANAGTTPSTPTTTGTQKAVAGNG